MDEKIKAMLEIANESYKNAVETASDIISKNPLCPTTDKLLTTLIQLETTNGCILAEILSLLNAQKDGNIKKEE